jgi:hypothetical protein
VASFDGGPCVLTFANEKTYSLSLWTPDWVENLVFPKGSAKIACILDYHYKVVANEESADMIHFAHSGETTYYKEGELEVVAHSETPLDSNSGVIVCNKKKYKVIRTKNRLGFSVVELYQNDLSIALIKSKLFSMKSIFKNDLPLSDRVFITLLSIDWWDDRMSKSNV